MQRLIGLRGALLAAALTSAALAAAPAATAGDGPARVINLTPDSAPGWYPSEQLEQQARKTAIDYLAALDQGRYGDAYAMQTEGNRRLQSLTAFTERLTRFNAEAGAVKERRITTVTWTADPAQAPMKGKYAAIDLISQFDRVDRHCGYLVMYQPPSGGAFQVMRSEENFLTNSQAAAIAKDGSDSAVKAAWAQLSAHCPGYAQAQALAAAVPFAPLPPGPLAEAEASDIGYPSVEAALAGLRAKPGVKFSQQDGWTIANDPSENALWTFTPPGHAAYPAVVKRRMITQNGQVVMDMSVMCKGSKQACDDLVRAFQDLNAKIAESLRKR
jgi:hypothetical protein